MNRSAQNKKLTILSILFVLCILGLGYWYFFMYRCGILPRGYEFLERFVVENKCGEKEYKVRGIMYNIREEGSNFIFDLNAWDTEKGESLYYKDISLNLDWSADKDIQDLGSIPRNILLTVNLSEDSLITFKLEDLKLGEEIYLDSQGILYDSIKNFNKLEKDNLESVTTEVYDIKSESGDTETFYHNTDGFYNLTLYQLWIDSYLFKNAGKENSNFFDVSSIANFESMTANFLKNREDRREMEATSEGGSCDDKECESKDFITVNEEISHIQNSSFGCNMIKEIDNNIGDRRFFNLLSKEFCNINGIKKDIENLQNKKQEVFVREEDLLQSLSLSRIVEKSNYEVTEEMLPLENSINFLPDILIVKDMGIGSFETFALEMAKDSLIYEYIYRGEIGVRDVCSLAYASKVASQYSDDPFFLEILNNIKLMFLEDINKTLSLLDTSSYASFLCIEAYQEDMELRDLFLSRVFKSVYVNLYNDDNKKGIWENDNYYNIRTNARLLKILLENYEEVN